MSTISRQCLPLLALGLLFSSCNSTPLAETSPGSVQSSTPSCPATESTTRFDCEDPAGSMLAPNGVNHPPGMPAPNGVNHPPGMPAPNGGNHPPVMPAPLGEVGVPAGPRAVIHERPTEWHAAPESPVIPKRITHMHRQAEMARARFAFMDAARMFRSLRDDAATPRSMRAEFHAALSESEDIAHGMNEFRRAFDASDFQRAGLEFRAVSIRHPRIPFSVLIGISGTLVPEAVVTSSAVGH